MYFLDFNTWIVVGHCISVDPMYLEHKSKECGFEAKLSTKGREINDYVSKYLADNIEKVLDKKDSRVLVLGVTFKENVSDIRNSKS